MARAVYFAPGVYVEEVPSAQQPIAGVGTNTVGFIGAVPNTIQCPVPNPDYDPVLAQLVQNVRGLNGQRAPEDIAAELDAGISHARERVNALGSQVQEKEAALTDKTSQLPALQARVQELEGRPREELSDEERSGLRTSRRELERLTQEIARLGPEVESLQQQREVQLNTLQQLEETRAGTPPVGATPQISALQPYLLRDVVIDVAPCDTKLCTNFTEYTNRFGPFSAYGPQPDDPKKSAEPLFPGHQALTHAVKGFFDNGGTRCFVARIDPANPDLERALATFESIDEIAIMAAPGLEPTREIWDALVTHCEKREDRFAILDPSTDVTDANGDLDIEKLSYTNPDNVLPPPNKNAACYFPRIEVRDPAKALQDLDPARNVAAKYRGRTYVPPSGHMAGIYARTDETRGVHKAPANTPVLGALDVEWYIGKAKQEMLNPLGLNCIRSMNGNITVWGARTMGGDRNGEWKYLSVRRFFLFLRESIDEGTQWAVFEPNDRALWAKIWRNVTSFLTIVWRSGALFGSTPEEAFYVKCDDETNPPETRDLGQVITEVGVAIVRPAEFVIFRISQSAGGAKG